MGSNSPHHDRRWLILVRHRHRAADGRARRDHREHRAAVRPAGPGLLRRRPPVGHHRLRAGLRQPAAARRPDRRPVRPQVDLHRRPARLRRRSALGGAAQSFEVLVAPARCRASSPRCSRPPRSRCWPRRSPSPAERGKAFGIYGAIAGMGGAIGLLLGGALTEALDWRWCLYVSIAFAVPAAIAGTRLLHHVPAPARPRLDIPGALTASAGCSRSSSASRAPRPTAGATPSRSAFSSAAPSCSPCSSRSSGASRTRCCRCGSSPTATAARRSWRSQARAPGSSACSCS